MAIEDRTHTSTDAGAPELPLSADPARHQLIYGAVCALSPVLGLLQRLTASNHPDDVAAAHQLAISAEELTTVIASAVGDDVADLEELGYLLRGPEANRRHVREAAHV